MKKTFWKLWSLVIAGALLAMVPFSVMAQEGYDPMLQILHQFAHPIVVIIQDTSGSMAWDQYGNGVGIDGQGNAPTGAWSVSHSSCSGSNCRQWTYTLTISQTLPSRMCVLKNAMGNSVGITLEWTPPASYTWPAVTWTGGTVTGPTLAVNKGTTPVTYKYAWTIKYSSYHAAPGQPFALTIANFIAAGSGGTYQAPADLVGRNSTVVDWGLETFSGSSCGTYGMTVAVNTDDNNQGTVVSNIENRMKLNSAGGLSANGSTPTKAAVTSVISAMTNIYNNDPKKNCGRAYGAILVTDGLSNYCNPNDGDWISPCGACPGPSCCDAGSSGYNCPSQYTSFAAGAAENLWNLTLGGKRINVRTWVIGVSGQVGPCELNYTAYMGRTDAEAGDAGFNTSADAYLPTGTGDTAHYTVNAAHPRYAYFATNSQALIEAFAAIVAAVATGDYTTSSPVGTSTASGASYGVLASTEFPGWKGHLYKYDVTTPSCHSSTSQATCTSPCFWDSAAQTCSFTPPLVWDAGAVLSSSPVGTNATNGRKIYTWNPNNSNALVEITATNQAALNTICGSCGITPAVIDFIRGNNGVGSPRPWMLGPIINATPAIVGAPLQFTLPGVKDHAIFESTYSSRTKLIWVGSNDGMLHAFNFDSGAEVLALLPPNLLAIQPQLYGFYDPSKAPTGQKRMPADQVYGVAGSVRYGDVYFGPPVNNYKTVAYLAEGPGGDLLAAIDITHPTPGDPNFSSVAPVSILWAKTGTTLPGLHQTWSTPAGGLTTAPGAASSSPDLWSLSFGAGYNSASTQATPVAPSAFLLDAASGTASSFSLTNMTTPSPWVGNQTFADAVIYSKATHGYYPDSVCDLAVQPDLNGRLWLLSKTASPPWTPTVGVDASHKISPAQQQPIYYSPAVSGFNTYDIYAFASGTFYEKSQHITGINVGQSGYFIPSLYVAVKSQDAAQATNAQIVQIPLPNLSYTYTYTDTSVNPPVTHTYTYTLGRRTQVTASPLMTIPAAGLQGKPQVLFEVYDPDTTDCAGTSYVIQVEVTMPVGSAPASAAVTNMTMAGSGAGSGFAIIGDSAFVAKSGVGAGNQAQLSVVPHINPTQGMGSTSPVWWRQLQ